MLINTTKSMMSAPSAAAVALLLLCTSTGCSGTDSSNTSDPHAAVATTCNRKQGLCETKDADQQGCASLQLQGSPLCAVATVTGRCTHDPIDSSCFSAQTQDACSKAVRYGTTSLCVWNASAFTKCGAVAADKLPCRSQRNQQACQHVQGNMAGQANQPLCAYNPQAQLSVCRPTAADPCNSLSAQECTAAAHCE